MNAIWKAEPTMILAVVSAGLALGMGFGLHLTTQQMGLIMAFVAAVLGLINRSQVTSPASLQALTPGTLATAQDAAEPVKDTIRKLPVVLLACLLSGAAFTLPACAPPPPNLNPQATTAFHNHQVQNALDLIRDIIDDGSKAVPPAFSGATDVKVATWHESIITIVHSLGSGWQTTALASLDELPKDLSKAEQSRIAPYIALAKTVIKEIK